MPVYGLKPQALNDLAWLLGTWQVLEIPEIKNFSPFLKLHSEIEFRPTGEALLTYEQRSNHLSKAKPILVESGFLKIKPSSNKVVFTVTNPAGIVTIEEGQVKPKQKHNTLILKSTTLPGIDFIPGAVETGRTYSLKDDILEASIFLQTKNTALVETAKIMYKKCLAYQEISHDH